MSGNSVATLAKNKRLLRILFPLMVVGLFAIIFVSLFMARPAPEERVVKPKKTNAFVIRSKERESRLSIRSQGEVMPLSLLELKAEIAGKLSYLSPKFVAGGAFEQGELLAQIDPVPYELAVIERKANVVSAEQNYEIAMAESQAASAELDEMGRDNASALARGLPQLRGAEAALNSARAELKRAEVELSYTQLVAPFNGRVKEEAASLGQYINRNATIATIFSTDVAEVRLPITLDEARQIDLPLTFYEEESPSPFEVLLSTRFGGDEHLWDARIVRTEAALDSRTRNLYVVARIEAPYRNMDSPLLMGSFVQAEIRSENKHRISRIPASSLRNGETLWLVDKDKKLRIVAANIVQRNRDDILVKDLPSGTRVITSTIPIPVEGMAIRPVKAEQTKVEAEEMVNSTIKVDAPASDREKRLRAKDANKQLLKSAG